MTNKAHLSLICCCNELSTSVLHPCIVFLITVEKSVRHWKQALTDKDMHHFQHDSTITHRYLHNNKSNPTFFPYSVKHGKYRNHTSVSSSKWAIIQQTLAQCNNIQHQATDAKWKTKRMSETLRWCMRNASRLIWPDFWLMKSTIGNVKCVCVCACGESSPLRQKINKKITEDIQLSDVAHRLYLWGENNLII